MQAYKLYVAYVLYTIWRSTCIFSNAPGAFLHYRPISFGTSIPDTYWIPCVPTYHTDSRIVAPTVPSLAPRLAESSRLAIVVIYQSAVLEYSTLLLCTSMEIRFLPQLLPTVLTGQIPAWLQASDRFSRLFNLFTPGCDIWGGFQVIALHPLIYLHTPLKFPRKYIQHMLEECAVKTFLCTILISE